MALRKYIRDGFEFEVSNVKKARGPLLFLWFVFHVFLFLSLFGTHEEPKVELSKPLILLYSDP